MDRAPTTPPPETTFAPGARVLIRDAEWVIRSVDPSAAGGQQLLCVGVSELVREREAIFLTKLEPQIEVLDPARTTLVPDRSPRFADSLLFMESHLRQAAPSDERIHVGHTAAMDLVPYQLEPARQALRQPRQRILIADAVGLGKTLKDTCYTLQTPTSTRSNLSIGWEDIRDLSDATITRTILDDTLPGGPHERTITYEAPFTHPNRAHDYRTAWTAFMARLNAQHA